MKENIKDLLEQQKSIEEQLAKLPRRKWNIWKFIVVSALVTYFGPYIPVRKGSLESHFGYDKAFLFFAALFIFVVPAAVYLHFKNINDEIWDLQWELENLKREIAERKSS